LSRRRAKPRRNSRCFQEAAVTLRANSFQLQTTFVYIRTLRDQKQEASTESPRLNGIVDIYFRPVPILTEWLESLAQIGQVLLIDSTLRQIRGAAIQESDDDLAVQIGRRRFEQLDFTKVN
jgi:hypothetical protein